MSQIDAGKILDRGPYPIRGTVQELEALLDAYGRGGEGEEFDYFAELEVDYHGPGQSVITFSRQGEIDPRDNGRVYREIPVVILLE